MAFNGTLYTLYLVLCIYQAIYNDFNKLFNDTKSNTQDICSKLVLFCINQQDKIVLQQPFTEEEVLQDN